MRRLVVAKERSVDFDMSNMTEVEDSLVLVKKRSSGGFLERTDCIANMTKNCMRCEMVL